MSGFANMFETKVADKPAVKPVSQYTLMPQSTNVPDVLSGGAQKQLSILRKLDSDNVSTFGSNLGQELTKLSEQVTKKVSLADSGFGQGFVQILKLTESVDINQLGEKNHTGLVGFFSKIKNKISDHKVEFMSNFNSTADEIDKISNTMKTGVARMAGEAVWLRECYDKNLVYLDELQINEEALSFFIKEQDAILGQLQSDSSVDPMKVADQKRYVDRLERQHDKIIRLIHVAKLTAPEIRLMQETNYNNSEDFKDLIETTIPAWRKKIGLAILSVRQKEDTKFSNMMKDKSNEFFKQAADMVHDNSIAAAEARNRSSLEIETIEYMQNQQIDAVRKVKEQEELGRQKRADTAVRLVQLNNDLATEMRTW